jgi:hypothetical protein
MQILVVFLISVLLASCGIQRSNQAAEAKQVLVGMEKPQVLACMGPPAADTQSGDVEVWSYPSGGADISSMTAQNFSTWNGGYNGTTTINPYGSYNSGSLYGSGYTTGIGIGTTRHRYCIVNLVFSGNQVSSVNYVGNTGGLITTDSECAYAVRGCLPN